MPPPAALPPEKTRHPLCRRLDVSKGRSGRVRKISLPPGFDPWTVRFVASRYTDYGIPVHNNNNNSNNNNNKYALMCAEDC
jgi:hypothetical protein